MNFFLTLSQSQSQRTQHAAAKIRSEPEPNDPSAIEMNMQAKSGCNGRDCEEEEAQT